MGFPPREMKLMSLWEYADCVDGWMKAHEVSKQDEDNMTPELFRAIMDAPPLGRMN